MSKCRIPIAVLLVAAALSGCDKPAPPAPQARPVRTITVGQRAGGEIVSLTGQVRAKDQASLAFRLDGRMIERPVNVGDVVKAGQVVARLDPQNQENSLRSAKAALSSAEAVLVQTRLAFGRQQELLKDGWAPRAKFDEAQQYFLTAQAQVDNAQAQLRITQDQLGYTVLVADALGAVTAVGAEPGEVVRAGEMIVQLAHQGGRDAVFDVSEQMMRSGPRDPLVEIALTDDPKVRATGRVREVAPQADSATRTHQVKVGIIDPPEAMRLGATVTGRVKLSPPPGVEIPAGALTQANGDPAVWVVDPQSQSVSLRGVDVLRYDPASVVVSHGLEPGDVVVTAGVQTLRPGQKVRLLGGAS
jgi:membrane fusion protein, multidrug efflux system